ncbi:hypothetical protein ACQKWADRAFT_287454 [Trichoderma austrokoningii]
MTAWSLFFFLSFSPVPLLRGRKDRRKNQPWLSQEGMGSSAVFDSNMDVSDDVDKFTGLNRSPTWMLHQRLQGCKPYARYRPGNRLELVGSTSGANSSTHAHSCITPALAYSVPSLL